MRKFLVSRKNIAGSRGLVVASFAFNFKQKQDGLFVPDSVHRCISLKVGEEKNLQKVIACHRTLQASRRALLCSTAKTLYRKFETSIPRKTTVRPRSQFQHSCICERFIYFHKNHNQSADFAAAK
jgi:hypothetical protein